VTEGLGCIGPWQIWFATMMVYDLYNSILTIARLRNIKELNEELLSSSKIPIMGDNNFTMTMAFNPGENLLDQVNNHTHNHHHDHHHHTPAKRHVHPPANTYQEEKITSRAVAILRRRRIIATFAKVAQV